MDLLQSVDWLAVAAPLTLAVGAVVVLLVDAFAGPPRTLRMALVPGTLTVLAVNMLGDGLRDTLDPRMSKKL